jgi:hypothetical protein
MYDEEQPHGGHSDINEFAQRSHPRGSYVILLSLPSFIYTSQLALSHFTLPDDGFASNDKDLSTPDQQTSVGIR